MIQMLEILSKIHAQGIVYRDLKPENICIGLNNPNKIYLIDFGLAKPFMVKKKDEKGRERMEHIPLSEGRNLIGTPRYASLHSHNGLELSRRDDLESLIYVGVFLLRGTLPWCGIQAESRVEKYIMIKESKIETTPQELCEGLPVEVAEIAAYTKGLEFAETPDYAMMLSALRKCMNRLNLKEGEIAFSKDEK